jgi:hypothetical protein
MGPFDPHDYGSGWRCSASLGAPSTWTVWPPSSSTRFRTAPMVIGEFRIVRLSD